MRQRSPNSFTGEAFNAVMLEVVQVRRELASRENEAAIKRQDIALLKAEVSKLSKLVERLKREKVSFQEWWTLKFRSIRFLV